MWLECVTIRVVSSAKITGSLQLFPTGLVNRRFIHWNQHQVKNYSKWLILRTRLANRTSFISDSYWYCYCNILPILGRGGRRFEYAGFKQPYTQFALEFPRTFSDRNSNLTIQPTRHARDSGYITITNESKGYIVAPMDHLSMSYRFLGHIHGFATPTL